MTGPAADCNKHWSELYERLKGDYAALRTEWLKQKGECEGTGVFEYYWGLLLEANGQRREAIEYLGAALKRNIGSKELIEVEYIASSFSEALVEDANNTARLRSINRDLERFVQEHPRNPRALAEQARELIMLEEYARAVDPAHQAADVDPNAWDARKWLVVSAARVNECSVAKPYIVPAIKVRDRLLADKDFMYAAASCYLQTGETSTAENVLKVLVQRTPSVKEEPIFQRLVAHVLEAKRSGRPDPSVLTSSPH